MTSFHTIVIGSGPGGTAAAEYLAARGKEVLLVSPELGGECLNYGCIPTKTYLWTAEMLEKLRETSTSIGLKTGELALDWPALKKRKNEVVAKLSRQLQFKMQQLGVKTVAARAQFASPHELILNKEGGGSERVEAEHIIIATGSAPKMLPGFPFEGSVHSNSTIIDIEKIPSSLLVIGGGAIGVESHERLLPAADAAVSSELVRIFARKGITVKLGAHAGPEEARRFEAVLVAIGRSPQISELLLEKAGVNFSASGIAVDKNLQTNVSHIYAVGDVTGRFLLAYTAEREGYAAASHILSARGAPFDFEKIPMTIFSLPEIAWIGRTEEELTEKQIKHAVGKSSFSANAKALIVGSRDGFVKICADPESRALYGVHIIGEKATELIGLAAVAMTNGLKIDQFASVLHSHPILGEVFKDACRELTPQ